MTTNSVPMSQWPSDYRYVIPVAPGDDLVTVTIDGVEVQAPRGDLLIRAAQQHGTYIPRFCWHERMKPVGMCRMCLVEVEGMRGLQISCATPIVDGMVVRTQSDVVKSAQDGVLEFLLINHPLDCPVCDRGGECPLQDQTLAFGPGESRFVEEKRHFEKPIPISDLVLLDRERCIQCGRCTRFAAEIAGDPLIDFGGRGARNRSDHVPGREVLVVLLRQHRADLPGRRAHRQRVPIPGAAMGSPDCRDVVPNVRGRLPGRAPEHLEPDRASARRRLGAGQPGLALRQGPLRIRMGPLARPGALADGAHRGCSRRSVVARGARRRHGRLAPRARRPRAVVDRGARRARGTNEDAFMWARFAKDVLGTDNVDAQLGDGLPAEVVLGVPRAVISDLDRARGIVLLGPDLKEELPVLHLRVRRAAVDLDVPVVEIAPRATGLTREASAVLRHTPGEAATIAAQLARALAGDGTASGDGQIERAVAALDGREGDLIVVLGRQSLAESADSVVAAAAALAGLPDVKFLSALRRGNVHGALDMGLAARLRDLGRVLVDGAAADSTPRASSAQPRPARSTRSILLGADLLSDFPDRSLVAKALDAVRFVVAVGAFATDASARAPTCSSRRRYGGRRTAAPRTSKVG